MDVPACLQHRPYDQRRKLPVPFVHDVGDGRWDYTVILGHRIAECVRGRLCGQCGKPLGWWMAFLGGPVSATTHGYSDPPMHEECARAALLLCPHITRQNMKRAKAPTLPATTFRRSKLAIMERPAVWVMTITRGYEVGPNDAGSPMFVARRFVRMHGWRNRDDGPGLVELSQDELARLMNSLPNSQRGGLQSKHPG